MRDIRDICSLPSILFAADRVLQPLSDTYEYHSVTVGVSMISKAFHQDHWLITPESHDGDYSKKRPDLVVACIRFLELNPSGFLRFPTLQEYENKTDQDPLGMGLHLIYEGKSISSNSRMEDALAQVTDFQMPQGFQNNRSIFVIIQRGLLFGFFEHFPNRNLLDTLGISHFRGCVSVTSAFKDLHGRVRTFFPLEEQLPQDLLPLYHNTERLRGTQDPAKQSVRNDAANFIFPCIFDFRRHPRQINYILARMSKFIPRMLSWFFGGFYLVVALIFWRILFGCCIKFVF